MKHAPIYIIMSLLGALPETAIAQESCLVSPHKSFCKTEIINLYVGPQSVEPGEDIFIAVETLTSSLESSSAKNVTIIDADTGQQYQAEVQQGLAYIEIKAPISSGRLVFTAKTGDVKSDPVEVLVHSANAAEFTLFVEKNKGQAFISSSIIADRFGNFIDDGQIVHLELIKGAEVYRLQQTQTQNGRIGLFMDCEGISRAGMRIRARIGQTVSELPVPAYICGQA